MFHGRYREKYCFVTILCARPRAKAFICVGFVYYSTTHQAGCRKKVTCRIYTRKLVPLSGWSDRKGSMNKKISIVVHPCCGLFLGNWELDLYSCASSFLKIRNPKSTNLAGSLDGAPIHNTISKTKTLFRDQSILQRSFTHLAFDASLVFTDCSAIATATCDCDLRACCAAAAALVRSHNTTPPLRPRRGLTLLGGRHNVESEGHAQKKIF